MTDAPRSAGACTTAAALAMSGYLLVSHPKFRAELRAAEGDEIDRGGT